MVANYLIDKYQLPSGDADSYAREAVAPGSSGLTAIVKRYGSQILQSDQSLDRQKLGEIIFQQSSERQWLESLIHPYVRQCFDRDLGNITGTGLAVIPLLFEANLRATVDEVWVVICTAPQQLQRLQNRNQLTTEQALLRINSQMPLTEKVKLADVVVDNSGSIETLQAQVDQAIQPFKL
jgi:dephospho-CoA kinase